jgi:hypothetical protein
MKTLVAVTVLIAGISLANVPVDQRPPEGESVAKHPEGIEKTMADGVISGGWEYVYAAYGLGALGVLGFAASLLIRRPKVLPGRAS